MCLVCDVNGWCAPNSYILHIGIYIYIFVTVKLTFFNHIFISHNKKKILNCIYLGDIETFMSSSLTKVQWYSVFNTWSKYAMKITTLTSNFDPLQVLSFSNSHVITCDRDEKIRVSRYPNAYNIETFCLGHTEWVISKLWLCILIEPRGIVRSLGWVYLGFLLCTSHVATYLYSRKFLIASHFLGKPRQTKS